MNLLTFFMTTTCLLYVRMILSPSPVSQVISIILSLCVLDINQLQTLSSITNCSRIIMWVLVLGLVDQVGRLWIVMKTSLLEKISTVSQRQQQKQQQQQQQPPQQHQARPLQLLHPALLLQQHQLRPLHLRQLLLLHPALLQHQQLQVLRLQNWKVWKMNVNPVILLS